jgi:hypothetical protein
MTVNPRRWDEGRQPVQELERREAELRFPIGQGFGQAVDQGLSLLLLRLLLFFLMSFLLGGGDHLL